MNGRLALQGNFHGLMFYNIEDPAKTSLQSIVSCPGGQGDVSIWGHLAFMSVEGYGRLDCGSRDAARPVAAALRLRPRQARRLRPQARPIRRPPAPQEDVAAGGGRGAAPADPDRMYGVRIFDITDPRKPRQVAGVQTCRGSHTHSIVTDPKDKENIYIYVSGSSGIRSAEEKAGCVADPNAPNTSSFGIDVIKVPLAHPEQAAVVSHAYIFADANTGQIASLHGRRQGTGEPSPNPTAGCHDVTSYPFMSLLGGACSGNGLLLDTRNVAQPKRLDDVADAGVLVLALRDVQQRRHQAALLRRMGRRHAADVPVDPSTDVGRRRGVRHPGHGRRPPYEIRRLLQDAGVADRERELRRAQRQPRAGARARHHGAGVLSGRRDGVRFHGLRPHPGNRVLRPRSDRCESA